MITPDDEPVLLDFGLARLREAEAPALTRDRRRHRDARVHGAGAARRRPAAASIAGRTSTASRATLHEALDRGASTPRDRRRSRPRRPRSAQRRSARAPEPRPCRAISTPSLQAALDPDPDRRYATAAAFADDLARVRPGLPVARRGPGSGAQVRSSGAGALPPPRRSRSSSPLALAAGLVALSLKNREIEQRRVAISRRSNGRPTPPRASPTAGSPSSSGSTTSAGSRTSRSANATSGRRIPRSRPRWSAGSPDARALLARLPEHRRRARRAAAARPRRRPSASPASIPPPTQHLHLETFRDAATTRRLALPGRRRARPRPRSGATRARRTPRIADLESELASRPVFDFEDVEDQSVARQPRDARRATRGARRAHRRTTARSPRCEQRLETRARRSRRSACVEAGRRLGRGRPMRSRIPPRIPPTQGLRIEPILGLVPIGRDPRSRLWEFAHRAERDAAGRATPAGSLVAHRGLRDRAGPRSRRRRSAWARARRRRRGRRRRHVDPLARATSSPSHEVTLDPFLISKYEMTQGQWLRATGQNPSHHQSRPASGSTDTGRPPASGRARLVRGVRGRAPAARARPSDRGAVGVRGARRHDDAVVVREPRSQSFLRRREPRRPDARSRSKDATGRTTRSATTDGRAPRRSAASPPIRSGFHDVIGNVCEWCADGCELYDAPACPATDCAAPDSRSSRAVAGRLVRRCPPSRPGPSYRYGAHRRRPRDGTIGVRPALGDRERHERLAGTDAFGRYRVIRELGRGGEAIVYLAEDDALRRPVAIKIFPLAARRSTTPRVRRGSAARSRCSRGSIIPGICRIHDAGVEDGVPFIAMSYVEGDDARRAAPRGRQPKRSAIVADVARIVGRGARGRRRPRRPQAAERDRRRRRIVRRARLRRLALPRREPRARTRPPGRHARLPRARVPPAAAGRSVRRLRARRRALRARDRPDAVRRADARRAAEALLHDEPPLARQPSRRSSSATSRRSSPRRSRATRSDATRPWPTSRTTSRGSLRGDPPAARRVGPLGRAARVGAPASRGGGARGLRRRVPRVRRAIALVKNRRARALPRTQPELRGGAIRRRGAGRRSAPRPATRGSPITGGSRISRRGAPARAAARRTLVPALRSVARGRAARSCPAPGERTCRPRGRCDVAQEPEVAGLAPGVSAVARPRREIEAPDRAPRGASLQRSDAARGSSRAAASQARSHRPRLPEADDSGVAHESSADAWHDATLSTLIDDLERLRGRRAARWHGSRRHAADRRCAPRRRWRAATRSAGGLLGARSRIRNAVPRYGGLRIDPQIGLVPIGQNPDTGLWEFRARVEPVRPGNRRRRVATRRCEPIVLVLTPGRPRVSWARSSRRAIRRDGRTSNRMRRPDGGPFDEVVLDPFFISKFEMTEATVVPGAGENGGRRSSRSRVSERPICPCGSSTGTRRAACSCAIGLELPTEAQWEHAARAGTTTPWWTGSDPAALPDAEVFGTSTAAPVGSMRPNPFGLYDVGGNVAEWCRDRFARYEDPTIPGTGERSGVLSPPERIVRGGTWLGTPTDLRSARRMLESPSVRRDYCGVRPARSVER